MSIRDAERTLDTSPPDLSGFTVTDDDDLGGFTVTEFARLFRISRGEVYKLHREKKLRFAKVNARTIITRPEARRFQAALETDAE
jgi:hypothetical protein